jgi:hypothetical protein
MTPNLLSEIESRKKLTVCEVQTKPVHTWKAGNFWKLVRAVIIKELFAVGG